MKRTIELPCEIGDAVWITRSYKGKPRPRRGVVSEMWFSPDMRLIILVKGICRGEWGKSVFDTLEEAEKAIERRNSK